MKTKITIMLSQSIFIIYLVCAKEENSLIDLLKKVVSLKLRLAKYSDKCCMQLNTVMAKK